MDSASAVELPARDSAGQATDHDVHAVLERPGPVVQLAPVGAAGEVRHGGRVDLGARDGQGSGVLGETAVVTDRQPDPPAPDLDDDAVRPRDDVVVLVVARVLLVIDPAPDRVVATPERQRRDREAVRSVEAGADQGDQTGFGCGPLDRIQARIRLAHHDRR